MRSMKSLRSNFVPGEKPSNFRLRSVNQNFSRAISQLHRPISPARTATSMRASLSRNFASVAFRLCANQAERRMSPPSSLLMTKMTHRKAGTRMSGASIQPVTTPTRQVLTSSTKAAMPPQTRTARQRSSCGASRQVVRMVSST